MKTLSGVEWGMEKKNEFLQQCDREKCVSHRTAMETFLMEIVFEA